MNLAQRLAALDRSIIAAWVYDHDTFRFRWANPSAQELWRAQSLDELLARDFSDSSESTRTRLDSYMSAIRKGDTVSEDWTLYPRGQPTTMTLHGSGVELDDGRLAILFQANRKEVPIEPSMIRGVEALRHTSLLVSLLSEQGAVIFHNPAALRAFGQSSSISMLFRDEGRAILEAARRGESFEAELPVQRVDGERWHSLRATPVTDPVSGERSVLLQQLDIHKRRHAEDLAEARNRIVEELNQTLALVEQQRQQILTLAAPILDVGEQTLAVPLIGSLTADRVGEIAQRLLPAVQSERRRFVILDLTGCSDMDATGAHSLSRFTTAVELLGSSAILTGIHPQLARAMITANLDFTRQKTLRTLREGIEYCRQPSQSSRPAPNSPRTEQDTRANP